MNKVLFVATVTSHINAFHIPYLKWFKEQGYEVHVASKGDSNIEYCDKHYDLPFDRSPFTKNNIKVYKELKKIIKENSYQIIHCHTPVGGVLTRLAAKKARKKGTKVIYTAHGFHFFKGASIKNWIIYYPIEKIMARYTDCLITINEEDYELAKKHLKAKKIKYVHGVGVDEEKFNIKMMEEEKIKLRESLGLKQNDIVISYVAELNENKNQVMIINSIKKLVKTIPNIKVLLIGKGIYKKVIENAITENKLTQNVFLLGYRKDVPQILKVTDLYISTSKREGLPVNIMEAMLAGLPIIATKCRGNRNLIDNNKTGILIDINDEVQLSEKIKELLENKKEAKRLGINAQKDAEVYKLKNVSKEMINVYKVEEKA